MSLFRALFFSLVFISSMTSADVKEFTFDEGLSDVDNSVVLGSYLYFDPPNDPPSDPVIQDGVVRLDTGEYLASPGTILS